MNTRFLLLLSLVIAVLAAWFYQSQEEFTPLANLSETDIEYEATNILAIQTNAAGYAEYLLDAESLTHNTRKNIDILDAMTLKWRPNNNKNITMSAKQAIMQHETRQVIMKDNVVFVSQSSAQNNSNQKNAFQNNAIMSSEQVLSSQSSPEQLPPMRIEASELVSDLDKKTIHSDKPIMVKQLQNTFESGSFNANLTTGDYEFSRVAVSFMPPKRRDVDLF